VHPIGRSCLARHAVDVRHVSTGHTMPHRRLEVPGVPFAIAVPRALVSVL
jgi:hypothetical protein